MIYTVAYRIWTIVAGAVTIVGVPFWFDNITQGYFYAFNSLVAAQVLFELGAGFVITQFVAHEFARYRMASLDELTRQRAFERIALLYRFSCKWFFIASILFFLIVGCMGMFFFSRKGYLELSQWVLAWCFVVLGSSVNLNLSPALALIEGVGQIDRVAKLRLIQSFFGHILMWAALFLGLGLHSLFLVPLIGALCSSWWITRHDFICHINLALKNICGSRLDWCHEVFPMQWKIALSWSSGYFVFQAIIPIAFSRLGPESAGQLGLALAIFNGVQSVGLSFMYAKAPRFAELIALRRRSELNQLFRRTTGISILIVGLGVLCVQLGQIVLVRMDSSLALRLPSFFPLLSLGVACLSNSIIFSLALYMRSHKEEPMLFPSVVGGLLTLFGVFIASNFGLVPMVFAYVGVTVLVGLPWAGILFLKYYARA